MGDSAGNYNKIAAILEKFTKIKGISKDLSKTLLMCMGGGMSALNPNTTLTTYATHDERNRDLEVPVAITEFLNILLAVLNSEILTKDHIENNEQLELIYALQAAWESLPADNRAPVGISFMAEVARKLNELVENPSTPVSVKAMHQSSLAQSAAAEEEPQAAVSSAEDRVEIIEGWKSLARSNPVGLKNKLKCKPGTIQ